MHYQIADFIVTVHDSPHVWHNSVVEYLDRQCPALKCSQIPHGDYKGIVFLPFEFTEDNLKIINSSPNEHLVTTDGMYINWELRIAFKITREKMLVWIEKPNFILTFLLHIFTFQHGMIFAHGASFQLGNNVIYISALGGIGKTALTSKILSAGGNLLFGDDFLILSRDGRVFPFPQTLCLYSYHADLYRDFIMKAGLTLDIKERTSQLERIMRKIIKPPKYSNLKYRVFSPDILFGRKKIAQEPKQCSMLFVMRRTSITRPAARFISPELFAQYVITTTYNEWYRNLKLLFGYLAMHNLSAETHFAMVTEIVKSFANNCQSKRIFQIDLPITCTRNDDLYENVMNIVEQALDGSLKVEITPDNGAQ